MKVPWYENGREAKAVPTTNKKGEKHEGNPSLEVEQSGKGGKQRTLNRSLTVEVERGEEAVEHGGGGASVGAGDEVEQRQQRRLLA